MKSVLSVWTMQWLQRPWEQAVNTAIFSLQGGPYLKLLTFLFLKTRHFCRQYTLLIDSTEPTQTSCICLCKHTHWSQKRALDPGVTQVPCRHRGSEQLSHLSVPRGDSETVSPKASRLEITLSCEVEHNNIDLFPTPHSRFGSWQKYKLCLCFVNFPVFY